MKIYDTIVVGGGQAGLSVAYFLRRYKLDYLILDDQDKIGGSWLHTWDSLKLFSPTEFSSLSGWPMPKGEAEYPSKAEFISYLENYQKRYKFNIEHNVAVKNVFKIAEGFKIETNNGIFYSKTLVSATGTAQKPFVPMYPNQNEFLGLQIHSVNYKNTTLFKDKNVLIVGGGNSGAQILAEVSKTANTTWITTQEPSFLPDDIDGRYLFNDATSKYNGKTGTTTSATRASLNQIVMIDTVKEARSRGVLIAKRPFASFYNNGVIWDNGTKTPFNAVIWCTGFRANLKHLEPLNIIENGKIKTNYTQSVQMPKLWLVGYGSWTGFASATIYGVGKTARQTVKEIVSILKTN